MNAGRAGQGRRWTGLLAVCLLCVSCQAPREAVSPIPFKYFVGPDQSHQTLMVFLPGNGDPVERFGDREILGIIENAGIGADVMAVDAHLGYYQTQTLVPRLKEDIMDAARTFGYRDIWVIGNSLGGLGALYYMKFHPADIQGVILLGPFLGFEEMILEVDNAGGVVDWNPGAIAPEDWEREFWRWVKDEVSGDWTTRRIYLGYGNRDRLLRGQRLLSAVLPPEQVLEIPGGHDWPTWRRLLRHFLAGDNPARVPLARSR